MPQNLHSSFPLSFQKYSASFRDKHVVLIKLLSLPLSVNLTRGYKSSDFTMQNRKTWQNKPCNTPKHLSPSYQSSFLLPSVPTFCFYLHTCPPEIQSTLPQYSTGNYSIRGYQQPPSLNRKGHFPLSSALPSWHCQLWHSFSDSPLTSELSSPLYSPFPANLSRHRSKANRSSPGEGVDICEVQGGLNGY